MTLLNLSAAREMFRYDPNSGELTWRDRPIGHFPSQAARNVWNGRNAGKAAGRIASTGYRTVTVNGRSCLAHRIVWLLATGHYPVGEIDHINGDPADNRLANLRDVSSLQNQRNRRLNANNRSGVSGVRWIAKHQRWSAMIGGGHRKKNLGSFLTFDEAVAARRAGEKSRGYHENHGRR
jgi:hypothetical protein